MITCSKTYRDIPLSHRQPFHEGRCARLHGHSWAITLTFEASELDENGFVIDFGELHFIEDWIDENLDHGMILAQNDPREKELKELNASGLLKVTWVESASCEGIARFLFDTFAPMVSAQSQDRVRLHSVHLEEDSRNSATYQPGTSG